MSRPQHRQPPDRGDERAVQDAVAGDYERLRYALPAARRYHDWWLERMLALADPQRLAGRVLDAGCGTGILLERLGPRGLGVDLSLGMLLAARRRGGAVAEGDALALPFADGSFDLVFARALLHHLPRPAAGVAEIARVLRPGGQAVFADTNHSLLSALPRALAYRSARFSEHHANLHRREYRAAVAAHLRLEGSHHFGYVAYPFGFPDVMGRLARLQPPVKLVDALLRVDELLARVPGVRTQSWGLMLTARKGA
ncbi:MAG TPA: class I SAM-dependent methyltransferase [Thermoanaerobaculia bacterium]|nr:class I SAM-dependent methyltransferase [Thermoanaerobaculia bacterium]